MRVNLCKQEKKYGQEFFRELFRSDLKQKIFTELPKRRVEGSKKERKSLNELCCFEKKSSALILFLFLSHVVNIVPLKN